MFLRTKNSIPDQKSMYFALNSGKNETIKASDNVNLQYIYANNVYYTLLECATNTLRQ